MNNKLQETCLPQYSLVKYQAYAEQSKMMKIITVDFQGQYVYY